MVAEDVGELLAVAETVGEPLGVASDAWELLGVGRELEKCDLLPLFRKRALNELRYVFRSLFVVLETLRNICFRNFFKLL